MHCSFSSDLVFRPPEATVADVLSIKTRYGFSGVPITEGGGMHSKLLGIVTNRDIDFIDDHTTPLNQVMTPLSQLFTARDGCSLDEANRILKQSKRAKLPIVNEAGELCGLISRSDLLKSANYPLASLDSSNRLLCGAAVSTRPEDRERVELLVKAGVDVVILDSSQGWLFSSVFSSMFILV